ncbi:hypothetical protein [Methylobacter luteus]|uniref:hypothetical protein n=1 Tax=Methylobacter luteus TaxID=415 RepID=UPI000486C0A4|nr:hypothetical protein [Methylobacter luteus]
MSFSYQRQNPYLGALFFFVARKKYLDMAVSDGMAANLEAPDQKKLEQERGEEILRSWEVGYQNGYAEMTNKISQALWSSFWTMVVVSAVSLLAAFYLQKLSFSLPFNPSKFVAYVGSALVGWAALMELGGNLPVWDGGSFPQEVHTVIFKAIFIPGVLGVLMSIVI